jgi:predicted alpha/beta hydrolase family esterase
MRLVFVHGIAQEHKKWEVLLGEWNTALQRGLDLAKKDLPRAVPAGIAYYGDELFDRTAEIDAAEAAGIRKMGDPTTKLEGEKLVFYAEVLQEMAKRAKVSTAKLTVADGKPIQRGIQNADWVLALARRVNGIGLVSDWTVDTFTRDVWVYLNYFTVQGPVDEIVNAMIPTDEPCVLVSHSLGTVVCYNVLLARKSRANIVSWVTLGSPLGMKSVYTRVPRHHARVISRAAPKGVANWYNARDRKDLVALYPVPADHFPGNPVVINADHVVNKTGNRHGIEGYLADAKVAGHIADAVHASQSKA